MTRGFIASLLLHLGLLAWALFGMGIAPQRKLDTAEAVEVAMISKADLETRQKQGDVASKLEDSSSTSVPSPIVAEKEVAKPKAAEPAPPAAAVPPPPEPPPPKPVEVATPPPPPPPPPVVEAKPAPPPPPPAEPKVDEIALALAAEEAARRQSDADAAAAKAKADAAEAARAKAEAAAKSKAAADAKKLADAKKAADTKKVADAKAVKDAADAAKKRADIIAAGIAGAADGPKPELLDKDPTKKIGGGAAPSTAPTKTAAKGPTAGTATGRDSVNTANEEALLRSMISQALRPCWRLPTAGGDSRSIPTVKLVWKMRPNGTVDGDPRVLQKENSPIGSLAADAALRAVTTCAFAGLPPDKYSLWREIEWDFDPRRAP